MRVSVLSFLFCLMATCLFGQYVSTPEGIFSTQEIRGCAPFTVELQVPTCDGSIGCEKKFDQSFPSTSTIEQSDVASRTFTYTEAGTYTISVYRGDASHTDVLTVTVFENIQPEVEISNCGANVVSLHIADDNYDFYDVNFGDGTVLTGLASGARQQHPYGSDGSKTVTVEGYNVASAKNCEPEQINLEVADLVMPSITELQVLDESSIQLDYQVQPFVQYRLEIRQNNNSNFQQVRSFVTSAGTTTISETIGSLNTESNFYCFRLSAVDACSGATIPSQIVCSARTDLAISNNQNRFSWVTNTSGTSDIEVEETLPGGGIVRTSTTGNSYINTAVSCGQEYCYRLIMEYPGGERSISSQKCGVAISKDTPPAIENLTTVTLDNGVTLDWLQPDNFTPDFFTISRSGKDVFLPIETTNQYTFTDASYNAESSFCYKVSYTDVCGNKSSEGVVACPIVLTASLTDANDISLSWSEYNGYASGLGRYVIEKYPLNGPLLQSIDVAPGVATYLDEEENLDVQAYTYIVKGVASGVALPPSVSNPVIVIKNPNLIHPGAFTPNGDALNDIFTVQGYYIAEFEMDIFNRWGELMFTTNNMANGWDGNYKNNPMPEGTYTFVANIIDDVGRTFKRSGTLVLLRKK